MNCLVTAGPTFEPLDAVRRLTNFSTGRLGTELANFLAARGHDVTLLIGEAATWTGERRARHVEAFSTTADLRDRLRAHGRAPIDAVFHAAAVSDFAFGKVWAASPGGGRVELKAGKFTTRDGSLLAELVPTPKLIHDLREWFPGAHLTGWKYEVDGDRPAALTRARQQLAEARTNACVVNGPAYGKGFGLLERSGRTREFPDRENLFEALEALIAQPGH